MNKSQTKKANKAYAKWRKGKKKKTRGFKFKPLKTYKELKVCCKCGISNKQIDSRLLHKHHITYDPEYIEVLCESCHSIITKVNTLYSGFVNGKLSNEERLEMWDYFMNKIPTGVNMKTLTSFMEHDTYFKKKNNY